VLALPPNLCNPVDVVPRINDVLVTVKELTEFNIDELIEIDAQDTESMKDKLNTRKNEHETQADETFDAVKCDVAGVVNDAAVTVANVELQFAIDTLGEYKWSALRKEGDK
jgi:hypothetical protein